MNIMKIVSLLSNFDINVRTRLATLNERLLKLERMVDYYDSVTRTVTDSKKKTN